VNNGQTESAKNDTYIGQGFFQRITNHFEHLQMNWVIKPNLFNHTTVAYDRWHMAGNQLAGGVGWNKNSALVCRTPRYSTLPVFLNSISMARMATPHYGPPGRAGEANINNRYQFLDDITWIKGKHTIKAGIEYRYMTFPQTGWR